MLKIGDFNKIFSAFRISKITLPLDHDFSGLNNVSILDDFGDDNLEYLKLVANGIVVGGKSEHNVNIAKRLAWQHGIEKTDLNRPYKKCIVKQGCLENN